MALEEEKKDIKIEDDRTGLDSNTLRRAFLDNLYYLQAKYPEIATTEDMYMALAYTVRDRLLHRWLNAHKTYNDQNVKTIGYLSAEYLLGPHLGNNLVNLKLYNTCEEVFSEMGLDLKEILAQEEEPGLGNGGLGRLAACFLDSLATLDIPAIGYGIRYEFGIFDQRFENGWQKESTDKWLSHGNPWEIQRSEFAAKVKFGGYTEPGYDENGHYYVKWNPDHEVIGIPYDTPILGYDTNTAATLRLWRAESPQGFDFELFNQGDYYGAVTEKINTENITKVLYPNDEMESGKELRLRQQYFFVSCSLQDALRIHFKRGNPIDNLHEKFAIQLNDTHPAVAVAELMRLLVDIHGVHWDKAWGITQKTLGYTNHTLLPEALEKWSYELFRSLLPRILEIILEINYHHIEMVKKRYPGDMERLGRMSIIQEEGGKYVRMANLACVGSHSINGVAELHSKLLVKNTLKDFYDMNPEKFSNKTNGVTPRRWVVLNNPELTELVTSKIGKNWIKHTDELKSIGEFVEDTEFQDAWRKCKMSNKLTLIEQIKRDCGMVVDPQSIFDVQVKRIHEYKRQHLNALHILSLYHRIKNDAAFDMVPRTFVFGGKAAPGYFMAKLIIKFINSIGDIVNNDPDVKDRIKVVFLPDYSVKNSEKVYPAADLSEQISMAGKEASGTGNMKFAMNGALTIGTLDGANIEIRDEVGHENFFLFGHTADEIQELKVAGYNPRDYYERNDQLKGILDMVYRGFFCRDELGLFRPIVDNLLYDDYYMLLADFDSYINAQLEVDKAFRDVQVWTKMSIMNSARSGKFSSDRTIREYVADIWNVNAVPFEISPYKQQFHSYRLNGD